MKSSKLFLTAFVVLAIGVGTLHAQRGERWVGTWGTGGAWRLPAQPAAPSAPPLIPRAAPSNLPAAPTAPPVHFKNQTLRQIVHTSIGGSRVRVVLSNVFGTAPMAIGAASLALREQDAALVAGSTRALTFSARPTVTIPAGAIVVSDPVSLTFPAMADLAIDLFLPGDTETWPSPLTMHNTGLQTNYLSPAGNHAGMAFTPQTTVTSWFLLARVEVTAPASSSTIVTIGDSITDGTRSTTDANRRWPDELARRLQAQSSTRRFGVLNVGIGGNRLLAEGQSNFGINALARFDRDVLAQPGVTHVVVLEGINDIGMGVDSPEAPTADDLIAAHKQLVERAHARGLKIFGATLLPVEGSFYFTPAREAKRQAVNQWLRTSKVYDAVIDFDAVVRDPQQPTRMLPPYNSGDSIHPSDAGYKAMAAAVDLALFK